MEPAKQPDQATTLAPRTLPVGSLYLADLGYFDLDRLATLVRDGLYFISRIQVGTAVFDASGRPLDLWCWLGRHDGDLVDRPIRLGSQERLPCRLVALRCSPEVVRKRRHRLRQEAGSKGRAISARQWEACRWTVLVTNVDRAVLDVEEVWIVYRTRWQIELLFKAWKGGNRVDQFRGRKPERALVEVYAKLLGILVQQWALLAGGWSDQDRSLLKALGGVREGVVIELARLVSRQRWDRLVEYVDGLQQALSKTARISRRRKRPSTYQLLNPPDLLSYLNA
jgi:hypothetical protein